MQLYSALVDSASSAVLMLSTNPAIVSFLATSMEADAVSAVNLPHYVKEFPLAKAPIRDYPSYTWTPVGRTFTTTQSDVLTDKLRMVSTLACAKAYVLGQVIREVSIRRASISRGILMQEYVYLTKKQQAQEFKRAKYPVRDVVSYPYVAQYAELSGLSPREAADEILFRAQLEDDALCKTETTRMKWLNKVRDAKDIASLKEVYTAFSKEAFGLALGF